MQGERLAYRLEAATKVAQKIGLASNLDEAVQAIVESARSLTAADSSIIYMQGPNCEGFEFVAGSPREQYPTNPQVFDRLTYKIITEHSSITNIQEQDAEGEIAGVPIMARKNQAVGALYIISNKVNHFKGADIRVIRALANFVPLAQGLPARL
jgi:GAF domain-containing protein